MSHEHTTISAVIRALEGNVAIVEVDQRGCGRCHEEGGCGGQQLTQMFCSSARTYRVINDIGAGVGDRVTLAVPPGSIRRTANFAYGIPLLALIAGALLGMQLGGDSGAMLGAITAVLFAFAFVRYRSWNAPSDPESQPRMLARI